MGVIDVGTDAIEPFASAAVAANMSAVGAWIWAPLAGEVRLTVGGALEGAGATVTATLGVLAPNHATPSWSIRHWKL